MHVFKIYSRGINRDTGELVAYRTELIDADKNELFKKYPKTPQIVKKVHEDFWNKLSPVEEKIIVDKVIPVNIKSQGKNWNIKMLS
jgi:hypothetical protein